MKIRISNLKMLSLMLLLPLNFLFSQDSLYISEFMALNNNTLQDEDSTYSDWIEIHNASASPINLDGWFLTDDAETYSKWPFPDITIDSNEYIIIFASGKNRFAGKDSLHTNFKLKGSGEFLALSNPGASLVNSVFTPAYPVQFNDISYGFQSGNYVYFNTPTPGAANPDSSGLYTPPPTFGTKHGYFYAPFLLTLSCEYENMDIYYTTDANTPDTLKGNLYTGPININTTTVVRAIAVSGNNISNTVTQTYIFTDSVIRQPNNPAGYPDTWMDQRADAFVPANYDMKQDVVDMPEVSKVIEESLKSLPVISLVSDIDNLFSKSTHPDSGGIYMYCGEPYWGDSGYGLGKGWERPASVEYFNPGEIDDPIDFQSNCAVKISGNASRNRSKTFKQSFRIGFKAEYGPTKLKAQLFGKGSPEQYDWFILRGGFDRRWGLQLKDPFVKNSMRALGQYSAYNRFVHVYLNGMYWGMYNLCEYMDENCMRDNLGGKASDYDVLKDYVDVKAGDTIAWSQMANIAATVSTDTTAYQRLLGNNPDGTPNPAYPKLLDPENLIDYILLNYFTETGDWDYKNWVGARRKTNSEGFQFIVWDAEYTLRGISLKTSGMNWRPTTFFGALFEAPEFRELMISRINKHLFEDGALTPKPCIERYQKGFDEIDTALIADQTRWVVADEGIWNISYHAGAPKYFSERTVDLFKEAVTEEAYPNIDKPEFNTQNSYIPTDFQLRFIAPEGAQIRYTTDSTDPGHFSLATSSSIKVYNGGTLPLPEEGEELTIYARTKLDTLWSILVKRTFTIGDNPSFFMNNSNKADNYLYSFPNPAHSYTNIKYSLSEPSYVSLKVYNVIGEYITTLEEGDKQKGEHVVKWNSGSNPSGIYLCILKSLNTVNRYRIVIVKE